MNTAPTRESGNVERLGSSASGEEEDLQDVREDAVFLARFAEWFLQQGRATRELIRKDFPRNNVLQLIPPFVAGSGFGGAWPKTLREPNAASALRSDGPEPETQNPLEEFFRSRTEGAGIWKWVHYFEVYHRHLARFVGMPVNVVEIGVYSGGSLEMWRRYFGEGCTVFGIDIQTNCKAYERENVHIFVGDQSDRNFWAHFREKVPTFDIVIDDGGHTYEQQKITLEETVPYLNPGGVYLCEDVHGIENHFAAYVYGISRFLNYFEDKSDHVLRSARCSSQGAIHSIHLYPYLVAVEKRCSDLPEFICPKQGNEWQSFKV